MKKFCYDYPRPAVATDIAIFTVMEGALAILLIKRKIEPFAGSWALPGGFIREDEDLDACARRELQEETGVEIGLLHHFGNFSAPGRDPRGRVISVAYLALTPGRDHVIKAATDAADAQWFRTEELPDLAFDHASIAQAAITALRRGVENFDPAVMPYLLALLPRRFPLARLQLAYEAILGRAVDKRNFRRMVLDTRALAETGEFEHGSHRPAQLYEPVA
jgi:8-oxo-dGTP diphosphatase